MKHTIVITEQPVLSGKQSAPDGAICGNGDLAAVLGNSGKGMRVFLGKTDLWCASPDSGEGGIRPLGFVDIDIPAALYNKVYRVEQRMDEGKIVGVFRDGYSCIKVELAVAASANILLISMEWSRNFRDPAPVLTLTETRGGKVTPFEENGIKGAYTDYQHEDYVFESHVKTGIKKIVSGDCRAVYAVMAVSNRDRADYRTAGLELLASMDEAVVAKLMAEHREFWNEFNSKASVELSDKALENDWYASQYLLAACKGKPMFPPGLYGNFITVKKPSWSGDYHLNYNYEASFYAAVKSNHPELTDYYADPLLAAIPEGKENASGYLGCDGIYYPVALGPKGLYTERDMLNPEKMFLGQKVNAAYAAVVMIMRWNGTRDEKYAQEVLYPYLSEVGAFWSTFLKKEKSRYVIRGDAIHEIPYYKKDFKSSKYKKEINATNSVLSLGAVRMIFSTLIDLCDVIPDAAAYKELWQEILKNLSKYPVKGGKYIYTQKGIKKSKTNTVGIQHIYPFGQVGTDKKSMKISKKTVEKLHRWKDENGTNSLYPAAVRVGIPAEEILKHYQVNKAKFMMPNMLYNHKGGCLENVSLAASMLNEMMLSSRNGVIRVFPNWKKDIDCEFKNLRADGAFLVSAKLSKGLLSYVSITSEKGMPLTVANPFTDKIYGGCNGMIGGEVTACSGDYLEIDLPCGETVVFTSVKQIDAKPTKQEKEIEKKTAKKIKKSAKKAKKAAKVEAKDDKFYAKLEVKTNKKLAKKNAKKEKREDKKYAKFDKKVEKYNNKRKAKRK